MDLGNILYKALQFEEEYTNHFRRKGQYFWRWQYRSLWERKLMWTRV